MDLNDRLVARFHPDATRKRIRPQHVTPVTEGLADHPGETVVPRGTPNDCRPSIMLGQVRDSLVAMQVRQRRAEGPVAKADELKPHVRKLGGDFQNLVKPVQIGAFQRWHVY